MKLLLDLFLTFARIGGLTFGGGYAMLPIIQKEVAEKKKWASEVEVSDYFALGQSVPGLIAVNCAIFIGFKQKKVLGAFFAALGVVAPSVLVISLVAAFMTNFFELDIVLYAFAGIRVAVCVLVVGAIMGLWKKSMKDISSYILFCIAFAVSIFTKIPTAIIIISAIIAGIVLMQIKRRGRK